MPWIIQKESRKARTPVAQHADKAPILYRALHEILEHEREANSVEGCLRCQALVSKRDPPLDFDLDLRVIFFELPFEQPAAREAMADTFMQEEVGRPHRTRAARKIGWRPDKWRCLFPGRSEAESRGLVAKALT